MNWKFVLIFLLLAILAWALLLYKKEKFNSVETTSTTISNFPVKGKDCEKQLTEWICDGISNDDKVIKSCKLGGTKFVCWFLGENDSRCIQAKSACK